MVDDAAAFTTLSPADLEFLATLAERRPITAGDYLYRTGDPTTHFFVVLRGSVELLADADGAEVVLGVARPGNFTGELNLLTGMRMMASARVVESGEVLAVPRRELQHIMATRPLLGDTILATFMARRVAGLQGSGIGTAIRVIGSRFSPESRRVREFLARNRIPHEWLEPERDAAVDAVLREFRVDALDLPVVIAMGTVLRSPTPGTLAQHLGLTVDSLPERCFDVVVVGSGPAGLAAAVYGASEGLRTLTLDMTAVGGQAGGSSRIENYLGFPTGISGGDLMARALVQAEKFGAHLASPCAADSLSEQAGHLVIALSDGTEVGARAVVAATGARYRRLTAARLDDFEGNGVYYAATDLEARMCAGGPVVVVGGGNSAGQAALFLAESGSAVTVAIRRDTLEATMSRYLVERVEADPRISVRPNTEVVALDGDETLTAAQLSGSGADEWSKCCGLFSFIGAEPAADWLSGCAAVDDRGFVLTDRAIDPGQLDGRWTAMGRSPLPFETSFPGLFAVGDLRS
ncbi:MAG TPA: FAD-dependent oxidoreductase, partial [Acidimicrobiales bacterium]|nr:FAD-dependent oxidoreductase [Acidimicrobiales bacterium]